VILDWKKFVLRSDIKNLPLEEQRRKFLKEQLHHDNLLSEQKQRQYEFYMSQMQSKGGGGGSGGGFTGQASDGPIAGATVTSNIGTTTTDTVGTFTFPQTPSGEITVAGGTDSITGVAFTGELKGFPQYKTISPLTTLAYHLKEEDTSLTADTAINLLFASSSTLFGVELELADKDIMLNKDYVEESVTNNNQKAVAAQSIATYLESVTELVGSAIKGTAEKEFTNNNAKVQGYKSIARQIRDTSGAKTEIDTVALFDKVTLPDGRTWSSGSNFNSTAKTNLKSQLDNVKNQLSDLSRSELYNANYLTTQIQSINRGVKEDYKVQAENLGKGQTANFKSVDNLISESTGSLAQIEKGKANETDANTSKKPSSEFLQLGGMTYTVTTRIGTDTLTGAEVVEGQAFIVGTELQKGKFLNDENGSIRFESAGKYSKTSPSVTATQVTASAGKVYEITLANPGFQILSFELKDATKYLPTGTYTLQTSTKTKFEDSKTQPFEGAITANKTTTGQVIVKKITYEVKYNSSTSRYEYLVGGLVTHYITDFTSEATWTKNGAQSLNIRFKIK
jgi:hypothetical protein